MDAYTAMEKDHLRCVATYPGVDPRGSMGVYDLKYFSDLEMSS